MKILHVIPSISTVHGGPSQAIVSIETSLADLGVAVTTLTTDDDGPGLRLPSERRPAWANGATRVYARKWTEFYKVAPGLALWLWRHAREFDVIHVHALFSFSSIAASVVARSRGVPYVVRPLGTLAIYGLTMRRPRLKRLSLRFVEGPILRNAATVHFTSLSEMEQAEAIGIPFRGVVVPLGVAAPAVGGTRKSAGTGGETILYLSRIDRKKNIEGLLNAFAIVVEGRPGVRLRIAGSGPPDYVASLKSLANELGVTEKVEWLGQVSGAAKVEAFAGADVFALPSLSENFGVAVAEAMLAGLPGVLGEGVAIAKEVELAGAGISTAPKASAIAEAMGRLLDDVGFRLSMGACAKDFAEREYSTAIMAERLRGLYESLRTGAAESRRNSSAEIA